MKLKLDLVPRTAWTSNLRNELPKKEWDAIRKKVYERDQYKCVICNGVGKNHPVEAHEKWEWDIIKKEQILIDIISLCPSCHRVHHYGFHCEVRGVCWPLKNHFIKINDTTIEDFENHVNESFMLWEVRNKIDWILNTIEYKKIINKILNN